MWHLTVSCHIYCGDRNTLPSPPRRLVFRSLSYSIRRKDAAFSYFPLPSLQCDTTRSPTRCLGRFFQDFYPSVIQMELSAHVYPRRGTSIAPRGHRDVFPRTPFFHTECLIKPVWYDSHACGDQIHSAFVRTCDGWLH